MLLLNVTIGKKVLERPALSDISKYIPSSGSVRYRSIQPYYTSSSAYGAVKQSNELKSADSIASLQPSSQYITPASTAPLPIPKANNDLLQFIEKQEGYIEQLERESHFCRVG